MLFRKTNDSTRTDEPLGRHLTLIRSPMERWQRQSAASLLIRLILLQDSIVIG